MQPLTLPCITLPYVALPAAPCIALHCLALPCITLRCASVQCVALQFLAGHKPLPYLTLRYVAINFVCTVLPGIWRGLYLPLLGGKQRQCTVQRQAAPRKAKGNAMAKATSSKATGKAQGKATAPAAPATNLPPRGSKYTGALPQGIVVPQGYTPTARAVALAQARIAAGASRATVVQYGWQKTAGPQGFTPNVHWVLLVLSKAAGPIGSTQGVAAGAALGNLPAGAKVSPRNWRHFCYLLQVTGHVAVNTNGGLGGYTYAITPKGVKALKAQAL